MIDPATLGLYVLASAAIVAVPGPTVTVIVANSLRSGARAGLMNVVGTQLGLLSMIVLLALGFTAIVGSLSLVFEVIRVVGALYLIWLGIQLWRANGASVPVPGDGAALASADDRRYLWQGFVVIWSNPKALLFFGAFIPQFVDPARAVAAQVLFLGLVFMAVATLLDSAYALLASRLGARLRGARLRFVERLSGSFLIGGGLWMLSRRPG